MVVAADEAVQDFGEEPPLLAPEPAHDAEIDGDERAVVVDEEISRMHVGVEKAVAQRVRKKLWMSARASARGSNPSAARRARIGERHPVDPFHRHHFARGAVPVDRRRAEIRIVTGILGEFRRAAASRRKSISMRTERASVSTTSTGRSRRASGESLGQSRGEEHVRQIARETALDAGPQHFHRDRPFRLRPSSTSARCT